MSQSQSDQPDPTPRPKSPSNETAALPLVQRQLPRYKVILLADNVNELMFIVRSVMELTRFPRAESTHKMWEAQHTGRSVILLTYKERAELYVEQFVDRGLKVSLEPA